MVTEKNLSGFQRFQLRNPGASEEDYRKARTDFERTSRKKVGPPNLLPLPDGSLVPLSGVSPYEIGVMAKEFTQTSSSQQ